MNLLVHLQQIEETALRFQGRLSVAELDIDSLDELIEIAGPLDYDFTLEKYGDRLVAQGRLHLPLQCQCVRCLRPFRLEIDLPDWVLDVPLTGEEAVAVVANAVDLTPLVREDILLAFPSHPLCREDCGGLQVRPKRSGSWKDSSLPFTGESTWAELDKLQF